MNLYGKKRTQHKRSNNNIIFLFVLRALSAICAARVHHLTQWNNIQSFSSGI